MSPRKLTLPTGETREVPRVTEVIRAGMPKPGLHEWELREVVGYALTDGHYHTTAKKCIQEWRTDHARHANRGTAVHKWIAAILRGEPPPALMSSQSGYKVAFTDWMVEHDIIGGLVEQTLTDATVTVAGTADFICDGHLYDWKTVEKRNDDDAPWPDQIAQLGAYASMMHTVDADGFLAVPVRYGALRTMPHITRASIVRLYADGTHSTFTLEAQALRDAIDLWHAVEKVAQATTKNRDNAEPE